MTSRKEIIGSSMRKFAWSEQDLEGEIWPLRRVIDAEDREFIASPKTRVPVEH
ncbi:hypothetical protein [Halostella limicola]|uniref:hypothetical protein n=1 Tax=Halostella limicola TaxID=2448456 RepID=UPI0013CECCEA|nr:hypothetical protein [Halostella limicola]